MDAQQFKEFKEEILNALDQNEKMWGFKAQMERLMSHVESELRTSVEHGRNIILLKDAIEDTNTSEGLRTKVRTHDKMFEQQKWMLRAIIICILPILGKAIWEMLTKHT